MTTPTDAAVARIAWLTALYRRLFIALVVFGGLTLAACVVAQWRIW